MIRLQARKRSIYCLEDLLPAESRPIPQEIDTTVGIAPTRDLGRQYDLVAPAAACQPVTDMALGLALGFGPRRYRIHLCGVNEIHPTREGLIQLCRRLAGRVLLTVGHAAQADHADVDIGLAQLSVLH